MWGASPLDTVSKADLLSKNLSKCFGKWRRPLFIGVNKKSAWRRMPRQARGPDSYLFLSYFVGYTNSTPALSPG
jgi:hypothetical protein